MANKIIIRFPGMQIIGENEGDPVYQSPALVFKIPGIAEQPVFEFFIDFQMELVGTDKTSCRVFVPRNEPSIDDECRVITYFTGFPGWSVVHRYR